MALMNLIVAIFIDELLKQTSEAEMKKEKSKLRGRKQKLSICTAAIMDFDTDKDGFLSRDELQHVLGELDANENLASVFEDVGVPVQMIKDELRVSEFLEDQLDVCSLLEVVTTAANPTQRRDTFELRMRLQKLESTADRAVVMAGKLEAKLDAMDEGYATQLAIVDQRMSSGSTFSSF